MKTKIILALLPLLAGACSQTAEYFPAKQATHVNPDTHLVLTFQEAPAVGEAGFIRIWDAASGECVDSLDLSLPSGLFVCIY